MPYSHRRVREIVSRAVVSNHESLLLIIEIRCSRVGSGSLLVHQAHQQDALNISVCSRSDFLVLASGSASPASPNVSQIHMSGQKLLVFGSCTRKTAQTDWSSNQGGGNFFTLTPASSSPYGRANYRHSQYRNRVQRDVEEPNHRYRQEECSPEYQHQRTVHWQRHQRYG